MSEEMKALRKQLLRDERSGYDVLDAAQLAEMEAYCADYKAFLTNGKTERLSVREAVAAAEKFAGLLAQGADPSELERVNADVSANLKLTTFANASRRMR